MKVVEVKSSPEKPDPHNVSVCMLYYTDLGLMQQLGIFPAPGEP